MHKAATRDKYSSVKVPRDLDQYIVDPTTKKRYLRGRFLGKVHDTIGTNGHLKSPKQHEQTNLWSQVNFRLLVFKFVLLMFLVYTILQGGFAKCYELTDMETKEILAGKIISKTMLTKPHQKEKVSQKRRL